MFHKACTPALPGGKAKKERNRNIIATKLERWAAGERKTLWDEIQEPKQSPNAKTNASNEKRKEAATAFARRGLPGKAVSRLVEPGLAPDTPAVEMIMRSKFITPPDSQAGSFRPPPPAANQLTEECVVQAVHTFARGAGPGRTGCRADFVKQLVGKLGDRQCVPLVVAFANLLANGEAPRKLAPYLGGATGTALDKVSKSGEQDARPVCSGEYWRRLVGKALLSTEVGNLRDYLAPHQLAVGAPAGVEVMPHLARKWLKHHARDPDRALLAYDEGNAHNEVDRHTFLMRMSQIAPGLCRWLEFIYPTDMPTIVVYRGRRIDSRAGGQQGCPLMMACHAVVQRILLEALGIVEVDPRTSAAAPVLDPPATLDMTPMFADDGFLAGRQAEVRRALLHLQPIMPSLGLRFSMLEVVPAAGLAHHIDLESFVSLGCSVNETANLEVLKSPIGSSA